MSFENDLFISYAHIDNEPLTPEQEGWVTRFHGALEALLGMRLGNKARIWRDQKLQGNDIFADEIVDKFQQTAALVSVLTPRYLNSAWCTKEATEFCTAAERSGNLVVDNKSRAFKVIKTPVEAEDSLPLVMQRETGYHFYTFEDETPLELDPAYGEIFAQKFQLKVAKLAWEISRTLHRLGSTPGRSPRPEVASGTSKTPIYLAECRLTAGMIENRSKQSSRPTDTPCCPIAGCQQTRLAVSPR